ncbi:NUDIX hydrolase [Marinobacterium sedimentorum]|uniref:NUDIX hydrolase n=1 Tax=Marinobacterium sedimentorum TaxID=2927804 RepID=UPI0020C62FFA|nr:NUDIX hydrolase [Marinobacterium sedimentorum]MCP8689227.1 NUDIX hydrolase [Marinobacterium sedimentorum]
MEVNFTGCKLAYILKGQLLVYKRDNFSHIPFPGLWDFPGGGREGSESPEECVLRELEEEFSITFPVSRFIYKKMVPSHSNNGNSFFFVAQGEQSEIDAITFGDEGQHWKLMPIEDYLSHPEAIPALISRLNGYLNQ